MPKKNIEYHVSHNVGFFIVQSINNDYIIFGFFLIGWTVSKANSMALKRRQWQNALFMYFSCTILIYREGFFQVIYSDI